MKLQALFKEAGRIASLLFVGITITGIIVIFSGENPLTVLRVFLQAAFGSVQGLADTFAAATPLILTGLSVAIAFKASLFNVGVEGSLYLGAFAAAWCGFTLTHLPGPLVALLGFLLAAAIGALWAIGPALAKVYYNVDEIVTTLMLNYVAIYFTTYLVTYIFGVPGFANAMSYPVIPAARLPRLFPPSQLNTGFLIAVLCTVMLWFIMRFTTFGYELRMFGSNPIFTRWIGMPNKSIAIKAMVISGALGGVAGATQILGVHYRFIANFSPGYGFTGIAVSLLARNNPIGVLFAGILLGAIYNGESMVELMTNIPMEIPRIFEGFIIALTSAQFLIPRLRLLKRLRKGVFHAHQ